MAVWDRDFRVSTITLDIDDGDGDGPLTPIRGLISASATANTEVESEQSAASTLADNAILKRIRPTIQFTTHDLKAAIDAFGIFGKCIVADANDEGLAFYGQKQSCTGPASGSVHDKYLLKNALGRTKLAQRIASGERGTNVRRLYAVRWNKRTCHLFAR